MLNNEEAAENDDYLDELIPSFFFDEEEDLPDEVNFQTTKVMSTDSSCEKHQSLKELVINHRQLLCKDCLPILSDYSRVLFDRGKGFVVIGSSPCCVSRIFKFCFDLFTSYSFPLSVCSISIANNDGKFLLELVEKLGYHSAWPYSASIMGILCIGGVTITARMLFDTTSESNYLRLSGVGVDYLLQLQMRKVRYKLAIDVCVSLVIDSSRSVFDRGKWVDLIRWVYCFSTHDYLRMTVWLRDFVLVVLVTIRDYIDSNKFLVQMLRKENFTNSLLLLLRIGLDRVQNAYKCLCGCVRVEFQMGLHHHSLMMFFPYLGTYFMFFRWDSFIFCSLLALGVYGADHVLEEVDVGYLNSTVFACLSPCSALHDYFWCFPPWSLVYPPGSSQFQFELSGQIMALRLFLTEIHIPFVLMFAVSLWWELNLFLMGLQSAGNVNGICIHSPSMVYFIMCCWYHRPKLREYLLNLRLRYQKVQFMCSIVCLLAQKGDSGVSWFFTGFTSVACFVFGGYYQTNFLCTIKVLKRARLMTQDYHTPAANSHGYVVSFDPAVGRNLDSQVVISGGKGTITKSNVDMEIVGMFTVAGQALKFLSLSYRFDLGYESELQFIYMIVFVPVEECDYGDSRLNRSQTNSLFENTFTTLWWHVVVMERLDKLYYRGLLHEYTLWTKLVQNNATRDILGVLWKVLLFPLSHFYLRGTENGCGYALIFITLLGLRGSMAPCISGNENHFLLQLRSGLYVKRGAAREIFWGYGCYAVFIFSNNYAHPYPFNNSILLSRSFCQVHFHAAVHPLSSFWAGDGDHVEFLAEVEMILTLRLQVGYLRWKFRLVSTVFCGIRNGTSTICSRLVFDRGKVYLTEKTPDLIVPLHVVLTTDCHWTIFILIAVRSDAHLYYVLMSIHGDGRNLNRSTTSSFVTEISVFKFLIVFTTAVMRYHKKVIIWLAKGYLRSQLLGIRVMVGKLDYFFIYEANIVFPTVLEFRHLTPCVVSTVQVQRGAYANCIEEKLMATPISLVSDSEHVLSGNFFSVARYFGSCSLGCLPSCTDIREESSLEALFTSLRTRMFRRGRECHVPT